ncbi:MAG: RMD1 family protein [Bacteroidetes bacterium]|nr:RMD1 family protein [Bacteroidota bacterium]HET6243630.1 RMD1 family protein [Bacteroidia bacterium]
MINIVAYQLAESINIKKFKEDYDGEFISGSSFELFYRYKQGYLYILNYGVVVFANIEELDKINFIRLIKEYATNILEKKYKEDFIIQTSEVNTPVFSYNSISVPVINDALINITMLQVAQSTALDYFLEIAQNLLDETLILTKRLELFGRLRIGEKNLLKFIGKTLNTKSKIIDDLYIIDSPAVVWEDEILGKVHTGLSKTFDISIRFRELEYMLKSVETNHSIFIELVHAKESHRLEWIIIILILIEVIHMVYTIVF